MNPIEILVAGLTIMVGIAFLAAGEPAAGGLFLLIDVFFLLFEQPKHSPVRLRPYVRKLFVKEKKQNTLDISLVSHPIEQENVEEKKECEPMEHPFQYWIGKNKKYAYIYDYTGNGGDITIPEAYHGLPVVGILANAFQDKKIDNLWIPDNVLYIYNGAFSRCEIRHIHVAYNTSLTRIAFRDSKIEAASIAKEDENLWKAIAPKAKLHFKVPQLIRENGFTYYLRSDQTLDLVGCTSREKVLLVPDQCQGYPVKRICSSFEHCENLEKLRISQGIAIVMHAVFWNCKNLKEVHLAGDTEFPYGISQKEGVDKSVVFSRKDSNVHRECQKGNIPFIGVDPQLIAGRAGGEIFLEAPAGRKEALEVLNSYLSGKEFLKVSVGKIKLYMQTTATTVEATGEKTEAYQAGLEQCSLWCVPVTNPGSGYHYQISLYAQSDGKALYERFHREYPGRLIRTKTVVAFQNKPDGVFVLHSKACPRAAVVTPVQPKPKAGQGEIVVYDGIQYIRKENGTLDVVGLKHSRPHLLIPAVVHGQRVVAIREKAFAGNLELQRVQISSGISGIEAQAFKNCANLTRITIPESVTRIHEFAFLHCGEEEITE